MNCPVCTTTQLQMTERSGVEIDYCPQCRGIWLDRGELDKLIERSVSYNAAPPVNAPYAEPYRDYDDDDHYRTNHPHQQPYKKKRGFLGEMFDIFD